ncbi:MAG: dipeptide epimerase [Bacteroidetes bacterium]|nr:dipeptide epimerase [Bacteroidota bacterium]
MILTYKTYVLEYKHPFGVSSNTRSSTTSVFIKLEYEGKMGYGEACLPAYLGETVEGTIAFFEKAKPVLIKHKFPFSATQIVEEIDKLSNANNPAKAAINIALHDLLGKLAGKPFYEVMGFSRSEPMATSYTIGIDHENVIEQKINEAAEFSILKIKAGTKDDKALINLIRKYTDKPLYVDVNQGWKNKEEVLDMLFWLKEKNVILIEQPMSTNMLNEMAWVTERSPIPTIADESVKRLKDLDQIKNCFSGINIKLMKSSGLTEALEMINYAKKNNLKILLGCMAESSCATSAMAQLMKFADYIDLDAPQLLKNDPFKGIEYKNGNVYLNDLAGIGVEPIDTLF